MDFYYWWARYSGIQLYYSFHNHQQISTRASSPPHLARHLHTWPVTSTLGPSPPHLVRHLHHFLIIYTGWSWAQLVCHLWTNAPQDKLHATLRSIRSVSNQVFYNSFSTTTTMNQEACAGWYIKSVECWCAYLTVGEHFWLLVSTTLYRQFTSKVTIDIIWNNIIFFSNTMLFQLSYDIRTNYMI